MILLDWSASSRFTCPTSIARSWSRILFRGDLGRVTSVRPTMWTFYSTSIGRNGSCHPPSLVTFSLLVAMAKGLTISLGLRTLPVELQHTIPEPTKCRPWQRASTTGCLSFAQQTKQKVFLKAGSESGGSFGNSHLRPYELIYSGAPLNPRLKTDAENARLRLALFGTGLAAVRYAVLLKARLSWKRD
jgi:hypothetical protein